MVLKATPRQHVLLLVGGFPTHICVLPFSCGFQIFLPPITHVVKGSLCTYKLFANVLTIIQEGISCWQLLDFK
jgi:hypothetical protein